MRSAVGSLREPVTIEKRQTTEDEMGGRTTSWIKFMDVWANVEPLRASQNWFAQHLEHRLTHKVIVRFLNGVTSDMRVKFGERVLQIRAIRDLEERNRFLELICEEGAAS